MFCGHKGCVTFRQKAGICPLRTEYFYFSLHCIAVWINDTGSYFNLKSSICKTHNKKGLCAGVIKSCEGKLINFHWPNQKIKLEKWSKTNAQWTTIPMFVQCSVTVTVALFIWQVNPCGWVFLCKISSQMTETLPIDLTPPHHPQTGEGKVNGPAAALSWIPLQKILSLNPISDIFCPLLSVVRKPEWHLSYVAHSILPKKGKWIMVF